MQYLNNAHFYGLAVKTGSIALQKLILFIIFLCDFFKIRLKNLTGHAVLNFLIFLHLFE